MSYYSKLAPVGAGRLELTANAGLPSLRRRSPEPRGLALRDFQEQGSKHVSYLEDPGDLSQALRCYNHSTDVIRTGPKGPVTLLWMAPPCPDKRGWRRQQKESQKAGIPVQCQR